MAKVPIELAESWPLWPTQLAVGDNGKILTDPVDLWQMLIEAGHSESGVGTDQKVIIRMAHSHLAELSDKYIAWAMAQLNPEEDA